MFDEDFYDEETWGYNGDPEHDMWVDYTTDVYEDTDYSEENYAPAPAHRGYDFRSEPAVQSSLIDWDKVFWWIFLTDDGLGKDVDMLERRIKHRRKKLSDPNFDPEKTERYRRELAEYEAEYAEKVPRLAAIRKRQFKRKLAAVCGIISLIFILYALFY